MTIQSINLHSKYTEAENDIVIYRRGRQTPSNDNPCKGFLKDGVCENGECEDCVILVLRFNISEEHRSTLRAFLNQENMNIIRFELKNCIDILHRAQFSVNIFVHEDLYEEAMSYYSKYMFYIFLASQSRRVKQLKDGVSLNDKDLSSACFLPSEINKIIFKYL